MLKISIIQHYKICLGILKNYTSPPVPSVPAVPSDFFQSPATTLETKINLNQEIDKKVEEQPESNDDLDLDKGELPKGFFDDPMLDAKVSLYIL